MYHVCFNILIAIYDIIPKRVIKTKEKVASLKNTIH